MSLSHSPHFSDDAKVLTLKHQDRLHRMNAELASAGWFADEDDDPTLIVMPPSSCVSAHAHPSFAVVELNEKMLTEWPEAMARAVLVHERVHLRIGAKMRRAMLEKHRDIDQFFHHVMVPDWLAGKVSLACDEDYLDRKGWQMLYNGWQGPSDLDFDEACETVDVFFAQVRKGLTTRQLSRVGRGRGYAPILPTFRDDDEASRPDQSPEVLYAHHPQAFATQLMTGFALVEQFQWWGVNAQGLDQRVVEENFANYIASALTGVSLAEMTRWGRQDAWKLDKAQQFLETAPDAEAALNQVRSYRALADFHRQYSG